MADRVVWVVLTPSKDLPEQWVSVIPELGLVSQGVGARGAANAAIHALHNVLKWDGLDGVDTFSRRRCPEDDPVWESLMRLLMSQTRRKFKLRDLSSHPNVNIVAFQASVDAVQNLTLGKRQEAEPEAMEPWMIASLQQLRSQDSCPPS